MAARLTASELTAQLNALSQIGVAGHRTDGQLVDRFRCAEGGERAAVIGALVERHGPMVLGVCRQVLGDSHDVHDAFQATFLVLLRKAGSIRSSESVASWLHGVALRVARRAQTDAMRRRVYERCGAQERATSAHDGWGTAESWFELHEEIARLPVRYREPLVLHYLEGLSTEAAAQRLDCPKGTVLSRLARGRERLRRRLSRRGFAPSVGLFAERLALKNGLAHHSQRLFGVVSEMVASTEARALFTGCVSTPVISLAESTLRAMFWTKLLAGTGVCLALTILMIGAQAALAYQVPEVGNPNASTQEPMKGAEKAFISVPAGQTDGLAASPIFMPLPRGAELRELLRRAASEAVRLIKVRSWLPSGLPTLASAQARAGDLDGARATFASAASAADESTVKLGTQSAGFKLYVIGGAQAGCGLRGEARETLRRAVRALPAVVGNVADDNQTLTFFGDIAVQQAALGALEDALQTVDRLLEFSQKYFASIKIGNARDVAAPHISSALAAVGDFHAAFAWSENVQNSGDVLGKIAVAAVKCLQPTPARLFVREAAERLEKRTWADETFGFSDLAEAQAKLGDVAEAKRSARKIGKGPSRVRNDLTYGQSYALLRIAGVQQHAGDLPGARATRHEAASMIRDHPTMQGHDSQLRQIVSAQIAEGDTTRAIVTLGLMDDAPLSSLAELARAQFAAGDVSAATKTFARALRSAGLSINNPPPADFSLVDLPNVDPKMSLPDRAGVAELEAMAGNVAAALKTVRSDDEPFYQASALQRVVMARAIAGDVAGALRIALDEFKTDALRVSALEGLGRGVNGRLMLDSLKSRPTGANAGASDAR